jgi:hypothetical protein
MPGDFSYSLVRPPMRHFVYRVATTAMALALALFAEAAAPASATVERAARLRMESYCAGFREGCKVSVVRVGDEWYADVTPIIQSPDGDLRQATGDGHTLVYGLDGRYRREAAKR